MVHYRLWRVPHITDNRRLAAADRCSENKSINLNVTQGYLLAAYSDQGREKKRAENVPWLILFAMLASVSFIPCFLSRSANSRHPTSARASSAFRNRLAHSSG
jgi:hypothetical protein